MLDVTIAGWVATFAAIIALLIVDWLTLGHRAQAVRVDQAARWSLFYVAVSIAFGVVFSLFAGWDLGVQYFTGYLVEKSLSVDNLFVFLLIIASFSVPAPLQPKALTLGIVLALALRSAFIAAGAALLESFSFMFLIFGLALLGTAIQLFRHRNVDPDVEDNLIVRVTRRLLPVTTGYAGGKLVTRDQRGLMLTPLFLALLAIGTTDLLFAFDSIPAVFGVTPHAYIVFVANAFALLGLRPLYFLVAGLLDRLIYMSIGLAIVLGFIGVKLVLEFAHHLNRSTPQVSSTVSLAAVLTILTVTTVASLAASRRDPAARAHPGSLRRGRKRAPEVDSDTPAGRDRESS